MDGLCGDQCVDRGAGFGGCQEPAGDTCSWFVQGSMGSELAKHQVDRSVSGSIAPHRLGKDDHRHGDLVASSMGIGHQTAQAGTAASQPDYCSSVENNRCLIWSYHSSPSFVSSSVRGPYMTSS